MKTLEVRSDRNGMNGSRGKSFASRSANSYTVFDGDKFAGQISQVKDSRFNFRTNCWLVCLPGFAVNGSKFQSLKEAKEAIPQA